MFWEARGGGGLQDSPVRLSTVLYVDGAGMRVLDLGPGVIWLVFQKMVRPQKNCAISARQNESSGMNIREKKRGKKKQVL